MDASFAETVGIPLDPATPPITVAVEGASTIDHLSLSCFRNKTDRRGKEEHSMA